MGKSKKKAMHSQKEEEQANKVLLIYCVSALFLVLVMLLGYSLLGKLRINVARNRTEIPRDGGVQIEGV